MNNWNYEKLSKLCFRIGDGLHGTPSYVEGSGIYFINGNNLKNGRIEITNNTKCVSEEELKNNFIELNENSLLLSINGTLGSMAFYRNEKVMLGKSSAYLNFTSPINKFYYYYFQLPFVQEYFFNVATGSTIKNLSLKSIQDFEVPVPEFNVWNNIANVLSSLDSKIELNNRINAELEVMAKTIYDYWFVQFDFPDKNGNPYKTSGGTLVWNEELKREIPEFWEVATIDSYAEVKKGELITAKDAKEGSIKVIAAGIDFSYLHSTPNRLKNTITISGSGANAGYINFWREPIFASDCITVRGKTDTETLILLQYLNYIQPHILNQATGSAQPHVYPSDIKVLNYVVPPAQLIENYGNAIISMNEKIGNNLKENQKLTELRDWLLPMLMNGQVKVN
jgi:type I restriction enzyme S subunit